MAKDKIIGISNFSKFIFLMKPVLNKFDTKIKVKYIPIVDIKILVPDVYLETLN
tara:strand:+ start:368 stop:529 length:162 start_codon:yes stop_codon:yes gene_type:complete